MVPRLAGTGLRRGLTVVILAAIASLIALQTASAHRRGQTSDQTPDLGALSDADLKAATIHLERTRCYGSCPAYTVTIHGDGRVEYAGTKNVKVTGTQTGRVEPEMVKRLLSQFAQAKSSRSNRTCQRRSARAAEDAQTCPQP